MPGWLNWLRVLRILGSRPCPLGRKGARERKREREERKSKERKKRKEGERERKGEEERRVGCMSGSAD